MPLPDFQHALKQLYLSEHSDSALASADALAQWLSRSALTEAERGWISRQPLTRLRQYRQMVLANVRGSLESIYPLTRQLLADAWERVTAAYLSDNPNPSYKLMGASAAFSEHLQREPDVLDTYPFLPELAAYEWAEAELLNAPEALPPSGLVGVVPDLPEAMKHWQPVLNRTCRVLNFQYPVPQILQQLERDHSPEELARLKHVEPRPTVVWAYRTASPYACRYFELNPLLAIWLGLVLETEEAGQPVTYRESARQVYEALEPVLPGVTVSRFETELLRVIATLFEKQILLGSISHTRP